jgi:hypothetical protein
MVGGVHGGQKLVGQRTMVGGRVGRSMEVLGRISGNAKEWSTECTVDEEFVQSHDGGRWNGTAATKARIGYCTVEGVCKFRTRVGGWEYEFLVIFKLDLEHRKPRHSDSLHPRPQTRWFVNLLL